MKQAGFKNSIGNQNMPEYKLTREEQETVIRGNAASQAWEIIAADPRIIRKMEKQGYKPDGRRNPWGFFSFTVPFDRVKIAKAEKRKATGRPFPSKAPANSHVSGNQDSVAMVS
jgi:hypothetical protein